MATTIYNGMEIDPQSMHPSKLQYIRVTSLKTFEQCPYTWAARYLTEGGIEEEKSKYAAIGTAVHFLCEDIIMRMFADAKPNIELAHNWSLVPDEEVDNVTRYLETLTALPVRTPLTVEERLYHVAVEGMPPISGQMDFVYVGNDGALVVLDHKTHRQYNGADWWSVQLQQLLYGWMARKQWPGFDRYMFRIGLPNLGTYVQWETNAEDDGPLVARIAGIWADMQRYSAAGEWPRTVNDECNFCPIKDACPERHSAVQEFASSFHSRVGAASVAEKLVYVKSVEKIVGDMRAQLEVLMRAQVLAAGGKVEAGGTAWTLEATSQRKAKFMPTLDAINHFCQQQPDVRGLVSSYAEEVFSVKVGGLDAIAKAVPGFKEVVEHIAPKVQSDTATLKASPIKKAVRR